LSKEELETFAATWAEFDQDATMFMPVEKL